MNITKRTFNPLLGSQFRYSQSEDADLEYQGNWPVAIYPDTVSSSTWTVEDGDAVLAGEGLADGVTSVRISGEPGESTIVNTIVTVGGQTDERIIKLQIRGNSAPRINRDYDRC